MDIDTVDLEKFIITARRDIYQGKGISGDSLEPHTQVRILKQGPWTMRNLYDQFAVLPTQETALFENTPVWRLVYFAHVLPYFKEHTDHFVDAMSYLTASMLYEENEKQKKLRAEKKERGEDMGRNGLRDSPFRGPCQLVSPDWVYQLHIVGSLVDLRGTEYLQRVEKSVVPALHVDFDGGLLPRRE